MQRNPKSKWIRHWGRNTCSISKFYQSHSPKAYTRMKRNLGPCASLNSTSSIKFSSRIKKNRIPQTSTGTWSAAKSATESIWERAGRCLKSFKIDSLSSGMMIALNLLHKVVSLITKTLLRWLTSPSLPAKSRAAHTLWIQTMTKCLISTTKTNPCE